MAVPQARTTPSKRGMRRSHDALTGPTLSVNQATGETHRRHHVTKLGYYRDRQVLKAKPTRADQDHDHAQDHDQIHEE